MEKPEIASFTTHDFREWAGTGALQLSPKFQRREVWKVPAKAYFIDSVLKTIPIPPIIIRLGQDESRRRAIREVVDGQQRLRSLLDFVEGRYALSKTLDSPYKGKVFEELPGDIQDQILNSSFLCEVFKGITDADVLEIFARVNTFSVALNAQELRNGRFFGLFKQSAYRLAYEYLEFWRRHKIVSENSIARMAEVELTSELLVAMIAGQQDKKKSLDKFYAEYDETFAVRSKQERQFRTVMDTINDALFDSLSVTEFSRTPLFYTLFCVIAHRLFSIPGQQQRSPATGRISAKELAGVRNAVTLLSEQISNQKSGDPVAEKYFPFVTASIGQTDNIKPRQQRFKFLYQESFR